MDDTVLQTYISKFESWRSGWGRAHYLSITEAPHNIEYLQVSGEETFRFFET